MNSPIFNALGGSTTSYGNTAMDIMQQFQQFRREMQGKNPTEEIQKLLQSGKISQQQLNEAQQMAMQMQNLFKGFVK